MTQSDSKIKMIPPRSISRKRIPRAVMEEKSPISSDQSDQNISSQPLNEDILAERREVLKSIFPATGKILTGFLRHMGVTVVAKLEEVAARGKGAEDNSDQKRRT